MALFCAAIWWSSVYLLRFPFRSHAHVFSSAISPFCRLKYSFSCFSFYFCFLLFVILLLLQLVFLCSSWYGPWVFVLMYLCNCQCLRVLFLLLFIDTYSLSVYVFYHYYYFTLLKVFPTSVIWWFLTGVWVTTSLLKSPGLFSVVWPIWIML